MTNAKKASKAETAAKAAPGRRPVAPLPPSGNDDTLPATRATAKAAKRFASESAKMPVGIPAKPKAKLVRDSFTIPKSEYSVLEGLKTRATALTQPAKKSELLRAGIVALSAMDDKTFLAALSCVPNLKTGRPKGSEASSAKATK